MPVLTSTRVTSAILLSLCASTAGAQTPNYPMSLKKPVSDTYHGVQVTEDYRWLEDGRDPAVRSWSLDQLKVTRAYLDGLPIRAKLKDKFAELNRITEGDDMGIPAEG